MIVKRHLHHYWHTLAHPKVFMFIILGAGVIFFTFLTNNNALEIAISGLASVFIGIGVNNFTTYEAYLKSKQADNRKERHLLKLWHLANTQIESIQSNINTANHQQASDKIKELTQVMELLGDFINTKAGS